MPLIVSPYAKKQQTLLQRQLYREREEIGISLRKLADRLHLTYEAVGSLESCTTAPGLDVAFSWARVLGLRFVWLDRMDDEVFELAPLGNMDGWQLAEFHRMMSMVKTRRLSRGLAQEKLALDNGVTRATWQGWERASQKPPLPALIVIGDCVDFDLRLQPIED